MKNLFRGKIKNLSTFIFLALLLSVLVVGIQRSSACTTGWEPDCGNTANSSCPPGTTLSSDGWTCVNSASTSCPAGTTLSSDGWTCVNSASTSCPPGTTLSSDGWTCVGGNPYIPPSYQPLPGGVIQPAWNYPAYQPAWNLGASWGFGGNSWGNGWGVNQPIQPQMVQCWNGTYAYSYAQCPAQQPQTQTCPNGQIIPIGQSCPAQTQTCWNGSIIPINQSCPAQTQTCPNGQVISINQFCPAQTQTCWNGLVLPVTQTCPSQYQTCWDGSVIPVMQSCPVKTVTTVVVKQVQIINHSVVTNTPTKVSQTSAECNGVALISNGADSVGWFEFGTTQNLGKTTNSADIGNDSQSSFSNVISGLKSNTTYYCRAVMANRDGTYRGKIVSFTTLAASKKSVVYASPKKFVKVKPKTKTEFVCSDGSIAVAKTVSIADTVNGGGKLLSIKIERSAPDLVQGNVINYRISITNDSDTAVSGAETKITLPSELLFVDATTTAGVIVKDNVMTVPIGNINSKEVKTFILPAKVSPTATVGKAVITTVYASYNLPVTGSQIVKDEVSAYMTANIVASGIASTKTNAPSLASMLFPQTLLGWLVLFAVILIIVVLVMNIRRWIAERKLEKEETIHHHKA